MSYRQKKGLELELEYSQIIHKTGVPVLISSSILREMGAGQVDICRWRPGLVEIFEVKSTGILGRAQRARLLKSCELLSHVFDASPVLRVLSKRSCIAKL